MDTKVQQIQLDINRRILIASDLHGHKEGFVSLLEKARFTEKDILVIVGDLLEKGPENLSLLRHVMKLSQTHTVYTLMGNVDYWRLSGLLSEDEQTQKDFVLSSIAARKWWESSILDEMTAEIGVPLTENMDINTVLPRLRAHFKPEIDFLMSLPAILETQNMIFVHGGIPHERLDELKSTERHSYLKWDHFLDEGLSFQKYVVVGHWPVSLYSKAFDLNPIIDKRRRILSIDGGCGVKKEGQINLLILRDWRSDDFSYLSWDGLPTVTAQDVQTASLDFRYIRWGDDQVTIFEKNKEWSKILYRERVMTIQTKLLYQKDNAWHARETTDYLLPVSPGDVLSVLEETPCGLYAKKDGVIGWYMGRYE